MVNRFSLLAVVLAVISLSCGTPTAPIAQGNISGRVYLQPRGGQIDQANHGITVALTGNQTYTTSSADSGAYVLSNVNQGIYSITYSKDGYISRSTDNIQFVGNGTLKLSTINLNQADTLIDPPDPKNVDRRVFGYVRLYDENGDSLTDHSGVNVTINGTSLTATTEKSGIFYFEKYPKGDFDITLSKAGFQDLVIPKISFPDSTAANLKRQLIFQRYTVIEYGKPPILQVSLDSLGFYYDFYYRVSINQDGTLDTTLQLNSYARILPRGYGNRVGAVILFGDTPDFTLDNYQEAIPDVMLLNNPARSYYQSPSFHSNSRYNTNNTRWHIEHAGKTIYGRVYAIWSKGASDYTPQYFENPVNKHILLSGYVGSNVFKITLPTAFK